MTDSKRVIKVSPALSRFLYFGMITLGIVLMIWTDGHLGEALVGTALFFDPFDPEVPFNKRPWWQQLILVTHGVFIIGMIGWDILN